MLRTRSSRTLIDPRIAASSIAELDGASPVSTENHLGQTAELCSAWTAGGGCPYASIPREHSCSNSRTNLGLSQFAKTSYSNFAQRFSVDN